jgi:tRNA modification GTPase
MDLVEGGEVEGKGAWRDPLAKVSALTGEGIETLRRKIGEEVGVGDIGAESVVVTEVRQRNALLAAQRSLHRSAAALKEKRPREVVAIELGDAATELGSIIGRGVGQEVLSRIFSRFCVGK